MLKEIQEALKAGPRNKVFQLASLIERTEAELTRTRSELTTLRADRKANLISWDKKQARESKERQDELELDEERLQLALSSLQPLLEQAKEREASAALSKRIDAAKVSVGEGRKIVQEYKKHAVAIATGLERLEAIDEEILATIRQADEAGRGAEVEGIPLPGYEAIRGEKTGLYSRYSNLRLPDVNTDSSLPIWPPR